MTRIDRWPTVWPDAGTMVAVPWRWRRHVRGIHLRGCPVGPWRPGQDDGTVEAGHTHLAGRWAGHVCLAASPRDARGRWSRVFLEELARLETLQGGDWRAVFAELLVKHGDPTDYDVLGSVA